MQSRKALPSALAEMRELGELVKWRNLKEL